MTFCEHPDEKTPDRLRHDPGLEQLGSGSPGESDACSQVEGNGADDR